MPKGLLHGFIHGPQTSHRRIVWLLLGLRCRIVFWRGRWVIVLLIAVGLAHWLHGPLDLRPPQRWALPVEAATLGQSPALSGRTLSRARLAEANALRRGKHAADAIRAYSKVILAPGARLQDVQSARAWRARLCLERGEASALDELMALATERLPPQLYAHIASTVTAAPDPCDAANGSVTRASVFATVIDQLERESCVLGASGERASRWLQRVRRGGARFFSR